MKDDLPIRDVAREGLLGRRAVAGEGMQSGGVHWGKKAGYFEKGTAGGGRKNGRGSGTHLPGRHRGGVLGRGALSFLWGGGKNMVHLF